MPLEHIVVLMLENASFDRMLGGLNGEISGLDGIDTGNLAAYQNPVARLSPLVPQATRAAFVKPDPAHEANDVAMQIESDNRGFAQSYAHVLGNPSDPAQVQEVMNYYAPDELPALHALARHYTVCNRWFSSLPGPTWPNRFFAHSGTCLGHDDMPSLFNPSLHIFDQPTIYGRLEARGVPWNIFFGDFAQSLLLAQLLPHGDKFRPTFEFFDMAAKSAAAFPAYSFIEPSYFGSGANDQHPPHRIKRGDALIAQVYNALRANQALWETTLLVVTYDEHGGFYDHVPPPEVPPAARNPREQDGHFKRYGVRVPAILVSPLMPRRVSPQFYDHCSLLKTATELWGLSPLCPRVDAAKGVLQELLPAPRADADCPATIPEVHDTELDPPSGSNHNQSALLSYSQFLEARRTPGVSAAAMVSNMTQAAAATPDALHGVVVDRMLRFLGRK